MLVSHTIYSLNEYTPKYYWM